MLEHDPALSKSPVFTWFFAVVVVRLGHRFLLVQESKHGQRWYLPAGRAYVGERLVDAAYRETLEESGIPVSIDGIIRIQHTHTVDGTARVRAIFLATPRDDSRPKSQPDAESLRAAWVALDELHAYPVRGEEVYHILRYVVAGGPIFPLGLLASEGESFWYGYGRTSS